MSTNNLILLKSWRFMRTHCYYERLCLSLFTNYKIHTDQINASSVPSITFNLSLSTLDLFPSISQHPWSLSIYLSVPSTSFNLSLRIYLSVPSISFNQSICLTSIFHPKIDNTADNSSRLYQRSLSTLDPFETISGFDFHLPSKHWQYCRCLG